MQDLLQSKRLVAPSPHIRDQFKDYLHNLESRPLPALRHLLKNRTFPKIPRSQLKAMLKIRLQIWRPLIRLFRISPFRELVLIAALTCTKFGFFNRPAIVVTRPLLFIYLPRPPKTRTIQFFLGPCVFARVTSQSNIDVETKVIIRWKHHLYLAPPSHSLH